MCFPMSMKDSTWLKNMFEWVKITKVMTSSHLHTWTSDTLQSDKIVLTGATITYVRWIIGSNKLFVDYSKVVLNLFWKKHFGQIPKGGVELALALFYISSKLFKKLNWGKYNKTQLLPLAQKLWMRILCSWEVKQTWYGRQVITNNSPTWG